MQLDDFDYTLPHERIAQTPIEPRDAARLLIDRGAAPPVDGRIGDLVGQLRPGDLVVVNDTKVIPARLRLQRHTGGKAEVLLLEATDGARRRWEALVRPGKKLRPGEMLLSADGQPIVRIGDRTAAGDTFMIELVGPTDDTFPDDLDTAAETVGAAASPLSFVSPSDTSAGNAVDAFLDSFGELPLPPYITQRLIDADRYQTVYARQPGSAAAPTAGLHFTPELFATLTSAGVGHVRVELVVGLDTFRPIAVEDPLDHEMHTERYRVPEAAMESVESTRAAGGRIVAVGTTTVRALESAATSGALEGRTKLFIHRGYDWKVVDMMMTNFHLPRTTLLMMIDAFVGDRWRTLYQHALDHEYRFLSFGDAMLLNRHLDADPS